MFLWCLAVALLPGFHVHVHASSQSGVQGGQSQSREDQGRNAGWLARRKLVWSPADNPVRSVWWEQAEGSDRQRKGLLAVMSAERRSRSHENLFPSQRESSRHRENSHSQVENHLSPARDVNGSRVHSPYSTHPESAPSAYSSARKRRSQWRGLFAGSRDLTGLDSSAGSLNVTGAESPGTTSRPPRREDSQTANTGKNSLLSRMLMTGNQNAIPNHVLGARRKRNPRPRLGSEWQQDTRYQPSMQHARNVPSGVLSSFAEEENAVPVPEEQTRRADSEVDSPPQIDNSTYDARQVTTKAESWKVDKRSSRCQDPEVFHGDLPWTCRQTWRWRHLGEQRYPSRIYEAVCEDSPCYYGHYRCVPVTYTLKILQVCPNLCEDDERVPYPLRTVPRMRTRWQYTDVNVTVGCMCAR